MPFRPLRLVLAYDDARGHCTPLVHRFRVLLEDRAFVVHVHRIGEPLPDMEGVAGLVLGIPVTGVRGVGPGAEVERFVRELPRLGELRVALFAVYELRVGGALDRLKNLVYARGAQVVTEHAAWRLRLEEAIEVLPTECMVRIR
jgi:hypothetical protein